MTADERDLVLGGKRDIGEAPPVRADFEQGDWRYLPARRRSAFVTDE